MKSKTWVYSWRRNILYFSENVGGDMTFCTIIYINSCCLACRMTTSNIIHSYVFFHGALIPLFLAKLFNIIINKKSLVYQLPSEWDNLNIICFQCSKSACISGLKEHYVLTQFVNESCVKHFITNSSHP